MSTPAAPQQPYVPDGYELKAKKKPIYKRVWFWLIIVVIVVIIAATAGGGGSSSNSSSGDSGSGSSTVEVVYSLESDAPTMLATYATASGTGVGQEQAGGVASPWSKTVTVEDGLFQSQVFVLSGSMEPVFDGSAADGTTITCRITVDGEVVAEQTSTGQYASTTCSSTN